MPLWVAYFVALLAGGVARSEPKEVEVIFDKPFYFMLTDRDGEVLFFGRVMKLEF